MTKTKLQLPLVENFLLDQLIHVESIIRKLSDNDLPLGTKPEEWHEQLKEALRRVRREGEGVADAIGSYINKR